MENPLPRPAGTGFLARLHELAEYMELADGAESETGCRPL